MLLEASFDICIRYRSFCASISNFVFFYIGVFLSDLAWAAYSVLVLLDTDCCVHIALRINHPPSRWLMRRPGRPQPPQRRLHSVARPHQLHRVQPLGRRSGGRSRRSGHQRNAGACDSWRQELTGAKFGMIIWTRIGGSCLGLLQTKTMSKFSRTSTKKEKVLSNINE